MIAATNRFRGAHGPSRYGSFHPDRGQNVARCDSCRVGGPGRDCETDHGCMCHFGCSSWIASRQNSCSASRLSGARNSCSGCSCRFRPHGCDRLRLFARLRRLEPPRRRPKPEERSLQFSLLSPQTRLRFAIRTHYLCGVCPIVPV